jgi:chromosome condensin MukBEF ATPase and DNA-binding subunit MukB
MDVSSDEIVLEKASQSSLSIIKISGNSHKRRTRWDREMSPTQREIDALTVDLAKLEREYEKQGLTRDGSYKGIGVTNIYITISIPIKFCCRRLLH